MAMWVARWLGFAAVLLGQIYELRADAGVDWVLKGAGTVSAVFMTNDRLLTGSDEGNLAAWDLQSGDLLWRLGTNGAKIEGLLDDKGSTVYWDSAGTLSVVGSFTGSLDWTVSSTKLLDVVIAGEQVWTLEGSGVVTVRNVYTGKPVYTTEIEHGSMIDNHVKPLEQWQEVSKQAKSLFVNADESVMALTGHGPVSIYEMTQPSDQKTTLFYSEKKIVTPLIPTKTASFECNTRLVIEFSSHVAAAQCDELTDEQSQSLRNVRGSAMWKAQSGNQVVFGDFKEQSRTMTDQDWTANIVGHAIRASNHDEASIILKVDRGNGQVDSFLHKRIFEIASYGIRSVETHVDHDIIAVVTDSRDIIVFDLSKCASDLQDHPVLWHKVTALGGVREAIIAGPTLEAEQQSQSSTWTIASANVALVREFILNGFSDPDSKLISHDSHEDRVIVVATTMDIVYGLSSAGRGRILWVKQMPVQSNVRLYNLDSERLCVVTDTSVEVLLSRNGATQSIASRSTREDSVPVPEAGLQILSTGYLLDLPFAATNSKVGLTSMTWISAVRGDSTISGREIEPSGTLGSQTWETRFPDSQVLDLIAVRGTGGPQFRSPVHVLQSRDILYKYENPNTLVALTKSTPESATNGVGFYLLDAVSGATLDFEFHPNAAGPVHSIMSENWIAYSFWRSDELVSEIHVLEVYAERPQTGWVAEGIKAAAFQLFNVRAPRPTRTPNYKVQSVIRAAFVVEEPIVSLAVTNTALGITMKAALVGLSSGRIVPISRLLLDPQRPRSEEKAKASGMKAPLYNSYLPTDSRSHDLVVDASIPGLSGINTAPVSDRESGSHVVAFGTDLFYTIYYSAGKFDTLSNDFNAAGLILTLLALLVAVSSAGTFLTRRKINRSF